MMAIFEDLDTLKCRGECVKKWDTENRNKKEVTVRQPKVINRGEIIAGEGALMCCTVAARFLFPALGMEVKQSQALKYGNERSNNKHDQG